MSHAGIRTDLALLRQTRVAGSLRRENRWPGGPRRVACLGCGRGFVSGARDERLCTLCRHDGVPNELDARVRRDRGGPC